MTNKELFNTRKLWRYQFDYKFKQLNDDGTEWWIVYPRGKIKGRPVSCSSELMCNKICYTAYQILYKKKITYSIARTKAEYLLSSDMTKVTELRKEIQKKQAYYEHRRKRYQNYKKEKKILEKEELQMKNNKNKEGFNKYKCPIHGIVEIKK